jgi:hypothetical protein
MAPWRSTAASAASREPPGATASSAAAAWRSHSACSVPYSSNLRACGSAKHDTERRRGLAHLRASGGMACKPKRRVSRAEAAGARATGGGASAPPCAVLRLPSGATAALAPSASRADGACGLSSSTNLCFSLPARPLSACILHRPTRARTVDDGAKRCGVAWRLGVTPQQALQLGVHPVGAPAQRRRARQPRRPCRHVGSKRRVRCVHGCDGRRRRGAATLAAALAAAAP